MDSNDLRALIAEVARQILEEAVARDKQVNDLFNAAKGAMGEYFKARYAEANAHLPRYGVKGTVEGWDKEASNLVRFRFTQVATRRARGYNPRSAFDEAMEDLRDLIPSYLEWAKEEVATDFRINVDKMVDPLDSATDEFFAALANAFDATQRVQ